MKELSIEEKAKRYDDLLVKLQEAKVDNDVCDERYCCVIDVIVPELKESEDERIRKNLIELFHDTVSNDEIFSDYGLDKTEVLAWLEKQGEQKSIVVIPKFRIGDTMRTKQEASDDITGGMPVVISIDDEYYHCTNELIAIKDQDSYEYPPMNRIQKPADKVEPKFHKGEWIVWKNKCYKVNYNGCGYELIDQKGLSTSLEFGTVDTSARLWDVTKDAKDGDVLYSLDSKQPFIFKHRKPNEQAKVYCGINIYGKFFVGNTKDCIITTDKYIPTAKVQRDFLFAKMKEAGYEWNKETKELKKIEQTAEIPFGAKDSELMEATYYIPKGFHAEIDDDKVVIKKGEQKPAWSEEDVEKIKNILSVLDVQVCWDGATGKKMNPYQKEIDWLQSIKDRYSWRPSDEQLDALQYVYRNINPPLSDKLGWDNIRILELMYQDLKKLK